MIQGRCEPIRFQRSTCGQGINLHLELKVKYDMFLDKPPVNCGREPHPARLASPSPNLHIHVLSESLALWVEGGDSRCEPRLGVDLSCERVTSWET